MTSLLGETAISTAAHKHAALHQPKPEGIFRLSLRSAATPSHLRLKAEHAGRAAPTHVGAALPRTRKRLLNAPLRGAAVHGASDGISCRLTRENAGALRPDCHTF